MKRNRKKEEKKMAILDSKEHGKFIAILAWCVSRFQRMASCTCVKLNLINQYVDVCKIPVSI